MDEYTDLDARYARAGLIEKRISKRFQKKVFKFFGVEGCGPHSFRRTFCTDLYRRGVKLEHIQRLLRHASIDDSLRYVSNKALNEDVDEILMDVFAKDAGKANESIALPSFKYSADDRSNIYGLLDQGSVDSDICVEDYFKNFPLTTPKMKSGNQNLGNNKLTNISSTKRRRSIKRLSKSRNSGVESINSREVRKFDDYVCHMGTWKMASLNKFSLIFYVFF